MSESITDCSPSEFLVTVKTDRVEQLFRTLHDFLYVFGSEPFPTGVISPSGENDFKPRRDRGIVRVERGSDEIRFWIITTTARTAIRTANKAIFDADAAGPPDPATLHRYQFGEISN